MWDAQRNLTQFSQNLDRVFTTLDATNRKECHSSVSTHYSSGASHPVANFSNVPPVKLKTAVIDTLQTWSEFAEFVRA